MNSVRSVGSELLRLPKVWSSGKSSSGGDDGCPEAGCGAEASSPRQQRSGGLEAAAAAAVAQADAAAVAAGLAGGSTDSEAKAGGLAC